MSNLIMERRKALGLTQSDLAEALGCTKQAVSNYERNTRECNYITLRRLARLLGVTVAELLEDADDHDELQQRIQSSGLTYKQLEEQTGVPKSAIQRYASGTTKKIPVDRLCKLDAVLGTETPNDQHQEKEATMCTKTRQKRERPSLPVTTRVDVPTLNRINDICTETGQALSIVIEKLLLYALDHVQLEEVTRKEMRFKD